MITSNPTPTPTGAPTHATTSTPAPTPGTARIRALRVPRSIIIASIAALIACSAWALWPLGDDPIPIDPIAPRPTEHSTLAALDPDDFDAPICIATKAPDPPVPPPEPLPPSKLRLLAIIREEEGGGAAGGGGGYRAMLYNPEEDRLIIVARGDSIAGALIDEVTSAGVKLTDASGSRTLALADPGAKR